MDIHKNARLTPHGRERLAKMILSGQTPEAASQAAGVCPRTGRKWRDRFEQDRTRIFYGGLPFVAGPERTAEMIEELVVGGDIDGVMFTFPDFRLGIQRFGEAVMPLLKQRGLVPREMAKAAVR